MKKWKLKASRWRRDDSIDQAVQEAAAGVETLRVRAGRPTARPSARPPARPYACQPSRSPPPPFPLLLMCTRRDCGRPDSALRGFARVFKLVLWCLLPGDGGGVGWASVGWLYRYHYRYYCHYHYCCHYDRYHYIHHLILFCITLLLYGYSEQSYF